MERFKRTLYIGIGGAGIDTLRILKEKLVTSVKNYAEFETGEYAKKADETTLPRQIKFLCIDTNSTSLTNLKEFNDDEKICVSVKDPLGRYTKEKGSTTFEFIPSINAKHISALDRGAGQIRSNGHIAIIESQFLGSFTKKLRAIANDMREVTIPGESLLQDTKIEVHVVFSLCGGTGSGMFLPISLLVREAIKNCEITGYMYSSTFFDHLVEDTAQDMVVQNAYAALAELDYCMHFGYENHKPIIFSFGPTKNDKVVFKKRPFEEVMFVDKQTYVGSNGSMEYTYLSKEDAEELTAEMLLLSATDVMTAHIGVMDNVRKKVAQGQFNVRDKFGWMMGFGLSELYFDSKKTLNKLSISKTIEYLRRYSDIDSEFNKEVVALQWLDDLKLNETGGDADGNMFINDIHDFMDKLNAKAKFDALSEIPRLQEFYEKLKEDDAERKQKVYDNRLANLKDKIGKAIKRPLAFEDLVDLLDAFKFLLGECKKQLQKEVNEHESEKPKSLGKEPNRYVYNTIFGLFKTKTKLSEKEYEEICEEFRGDSFPIIKEYARLQCEIDRKQNAIKFYDQLINYVGSQIERLNDWSKKIKKVLAVGIQEQNKYIQLGEQEQTKTDKKEKVGKNRINVNSSVEYLSITNPIDEGKLSLYLDDDKVTEKNIYDILLEDVRNAILKGNEEKNLLYDVIESYDRTKNYSVLDNLLKNSAPLMSMDFHGESLLIDEFNYIVGKESVAVKLQEILQKLYPKKFTVIPVSSMPDNVILYRIVGAVPPYFVSGIAGSTDPLSMEHVYEVSKMRDLTYTPFSHTTLQEELENKFAVLKPLDAVGDEIVLDTWINFILLGYIQRSESNPKRYWIESESSGKRLNDDLENRKKILILGEDRVSAFETFRRYCANLLDDYENIYKTDKKVRRFAVNSEKVAVEDVPVNYYLDSNNCLMTKAERDELHKGDGEFELMDKEISYIIKRLDELNSQRESARLDDEIVNQNKNR